jgi:hypothetical protein
MAATAAEAFTQGTTFGQANIAGNKSQINTGNASARVPSYTSSSPTEESYYMGGMGSLTAPASGQVTGCTGSSTDLDAPTHGKCESVRMIMHDPGKKDMMFPLNKYSDPLVVKRNAVNSNAETYLGSMTPTGTYSGCTERTVTAHDTYITETCNQYLAPEENQTCYEVLNVTIDLVQACVPGTPEFPFQFNTTDVGGESWKISSICFGGVTLVECWSGGYQANSFTAPSPSNFVPTVNDARIGPVAFGTTCYPHTHYPDKYREFYYSQPVCDPNTDFCTMTMYSVPHWAETTLLCPDGSYLAQNNLFGTSACYTYDPNCDCDVEVQGTPVLNYTQQWTQQYRRTGITPTPVDSWDNQCSALQARVPTQ